LPIDSTLISIDSIDFEKYPDHQDLRAWINDTILLSGWKISYLVKNDSTMQSDVYIAWQKDSLSYIYFGEQLLEFRRYFIPTFEFENDKYLFMDYGCSTYCSANMAISKEDPSNFEAFYHVVNFNKEKTIISYLTEITYTRQDTIYEIKAVDFNKEKKGILSLPRICSSPYKPNCIDTFIYHNETIEIRTELRKSFEDTVYYKETNLLEMKDDYILN